ncbi:hypothetical protein ARSEF4850_010101 [Beauveria asiatica]
MSSHRRYATKDGLVAGTALRLQPPMWDTPRKRTAPWEDILAVGKADPSSEDETLVLDR